MPKDLVAVIALSLFAIGFALGVFTQESIIIAKFEKAAIQHNAGQYNPTTGRFEWLNKSNGEKE